jgi:hypothetical protein
MFQVLLNTLLDGVFQKYLPIFFWGQKDWAVQHCFNVHFCKILNYTFHFTSCRTCCIAPGKKLIIDGIFVLLHIQGHLTLILMDLTRLGVLAAILCVWHLFLPLINKGSQNDVLSVMTLLQTRWSVLIPRRGKRLFLQNVHMGSGDHQASYSLSIGKWGGGWGKTKPRTGHERSEGELWNSCTLSLTSAWDGIGWSTPRPSHSTPMKESQSPLYRRLDGPQDWPRQVWKITPTSTRTPGRPTHDESL